MEVDKVADKKANMEVHKVADMVADMKVNMVADKEVDKLADMVAGHGCWLIGPELFRPKPWVSSKLCEFIYLLMHCIWVLSLYLYLCLSLHFT